MAPRIIRFHADRSGICCTLLCRVDRYLLCSAIMVCLLGHTAVQTYVAEGFLAVEATRQGSALPLLRCIFKFSIQTEFCSVPLSRFLATLIVPTYVFQDKNLQRTLEQISDTPVPQVVVVLVEVFVFSQDRVPVFDRRQ